MLPHPGPRRRYRVAAENGLVIVDAAPMSLKPWMELAGCLADETEELRRIGSVVEEEFGRINRGD